MQDRQCQRIPWTTPELQRIEAGSAEARVNKGVKDDGGVPSQDKS